MILDELEALVAKKKNRKIQIETGRFFWVRLADSIGKAREGRLGWPHHQREANEEDICRWALNCALLMNGLSPHWMPLLPNRKTIAQMKAKASRKLPKPIHNWMMLAPSNEWTRGYICLLEGRWAMGGPETKIRK